MRLLELRPVLQTTDLRGSVESYTKVLGFRCVALSDEWGWATLRRDGAAIMLARPHDHEAFREPRFTGSIYLTTDDVAAIWHQVQGKARICYPMEDFDYGMREFAVYDMDGYMIQIGQELPAA